MAFDAKELMIDITKAGGAQFCLANTFHCGYPSLCHCTYQITCYCTFGCTFQFTFHCVLNTFKACQLGTYTCLDTKITCAGTPYCAATEPLPYGQGVDPETLSAMKTQLHAALKEVEQHEKHLAAAEKKK